MTPAQAAYEAHKAGLAHFKWHDLPGETKALWERVAEAEIAEAPIDSDLASAAYLMGAADAREAIADAISLPMGVIPATAKRFVNSADIARAVERKEGRG